MICRSGLVDGNMTPMDAQQALAKFHLRKKKDMGIVAVSSLCKMQRSHVFFLVSRSVVFTRSLSSKSQKKTLCFIWHLERLLCFFASDV